MNPFPSYNRRKFLQTLGAAGLMAPFITRDLMAASKPPKPQILRHASFGSSGMAWNDIQSICGHESVKLVAIAEVDLERAKEAQGKFPEARVYQDWREMLAKEHRNLDSVNVSTPDHMHAQQAMAAMRLGKHVYCQKPLAQNIYETRQLTEYARRKGVVTQMGIQIHSLKVYREAVAIIQSGMIGKVREVHLWSGKKWGATGAPPVTADPIPEGFNWDVWLGGCADRPYIGNGYYHPGQWRKRLDFGTGTFGDMGCHIFDPVFEALALTAPLTVRSEGLAPDEWNWGINAKIRYIFPGTAYTSGSTVAFNWYDGDQLPPAEVLALVKEEDQVIPETPTDKKRRTPTGLPPQGCIIIGTEGTMLLPHFSTPSLFPIAKFKDLPRPKITGGSHWAQWVEACLGRGKTSAGFDYSGPLTEAVLLGSVAVRFPETTLEWDSRRLRFSNEKQANQYIRRRYRKGWSARGL